MRHHVYLCRIRRTGFNPRTHTGCDNPCCLLFGPLRLFQSTHPHGVRRAVGVGSRLKFMFQSTHPHGVRHRAYKRLPEWLSFNPRTHTGCDFPHVHIFPYLVVSIHAPTRGATIVYIRSYIFGYVSIHAPTRGATFLCFHPASVAQFQSTHPHGVRRRPFRAFSSIPMFQSTHPHGVRLSTTHYPARYASAFQSTHPHGVRHFR